MPEHMRIQLLDPKWAKDKKKFQEKQKESNLVGGDAIAANITRFGGPIGASKFVSLSPWKISKTYVEFSSYFSFASLVQVLLRKSPKC
jgi:hypothetical protein